MRRFFVAPEDLQGQEVSLQGEVLHHLGVVLRQRAGEEIELLDGLGTICRCRIESVGRRGGTARILQRWSEIETAFPVHLLQSLPKGDKLDLVLQKGTELGITAFTLVLAGRTVPQPGGSRERRNRRWERIIQEAARQCRRPILPHLTPPLPLAEATAQCTEELRLMLWEEESRPLAEVLPPRAPAGAAILVGPEGGFSAREAEIARAAGFQPVHLGPRILRSETAGFAAAAILQYHFGDLGFSPSRIPS